MRGKKKRFPCIAPGPLTYRLVNPVAGVRYLPLKNCLRSTAGFPTIKHYSKTLLFPPVFGEFLGATSPLRTTTTTDGQLTMSSNATTFTSPLAHAGVSMGNLPPQVDRVLDVIANTSIATWFFTLLALAVAYDQSEFQSSFWELLLHWSPIFLTTAIAIHS